MNSYEDATAQPEIVAAGVSVYKVGDTMSAAGNLTQAAADVADEHNGDAGIRIITTAVGYIVGSKIEGAVPEEAIVVAESLTDKIIDKTQEKALETSHHE